jgi:hypothetical protein
MYCDGKSKRVSLLHEPIDDFGDGVDIELEWSHTDDDTDKVKYEIVASGYYDGGYCCGVSRVKIAYCPFCGEELL